MNSINSQSNSGNISLADTPLFFYQRGFSFIQRIRRCEPYFHCALALCALCSDRYAVRAQIAILRRMPKASEVLSLTLTMADVSDLEEGYERLARARIAFESKIKNLTEAFYTSTELTDSTGVTWHWHLNVVLYASQVSPEALKAIWVDIVHGLGIEARTGLQKHRSKAPEDAVEYAVKARLGYGPASLRGLGTRAAQGDANADERWEQVQRFYLAKPYRRWRSSWVAKAPTPARITAPTFDYSSSSDLRRLVILDRLGVTGRQVQADVMTSAGHRISTATISRIRRHPLMVGRPS
ncbi:hypothetical protein BH09ACT5_BH09ACT5_01190 [soil metagenome]